MRLRPPKTVIRLQDFKAEIGVREEIKISHKVEQYLNKAVCKHRKKVFFCN